VKEYDIFLPLYYNDGQPIEIERFQDVQGQLLAEFEGLTFFSQPNQGFWKMGEVTFRDEIVILRVIAANQKNARKFLRQLKEDLKRDFRQEEILIVERDVSTL
jgi:hypothetical protein